MAGRPAGKEFARNGLVRNTVLVTAVVAVFGAAFAVVWIASTGLITIAAGILLGVFLDTAARGLGYVVRWRRHLRLVVVFLLLAAVIVFALYWGGSVLAQEATHFMSAMTNLIRKASDLLHSGKLGPVFQRVDLANLLPSGTMIYGGAESATAAFVRVVSITAAILFLGAFFAWEPGVYKAIVLSLLPRNRRKRIDEVLDLAGHALREWLIGQGISMAAIFLFCLCALTLVGMPYSILLAVQAGLLTFIPTLGPFVAGVIIILAGLSQSFSMALYGLVTYILVQFIETHLVTPLAQEQTVRFPPASTLSLQVVAAFLFGLMGIAFAVPISAAGRVFVEELYVKDQLGGAWHAGEKESWIGDWMRSFRYWIRGKWFRSAVRGVMDRAEETGSRPRQPARRGNAGERNESDGDNPEPPTKRRVDLPPF